MNKDEPAKSPTAHEAAPGDSPAAPDTSSSTRGDGPQGERVAPPPADFHAYIGRQLRAVYDDVAKQPVPERFLDLMRKLERSG